MIMCNNRERDLLEGNRNIDHFFPRKAENYVVSRRVACEFSL